MTIPEEKEEAWEGVEGLIFKFSGKLGLAKLGLAISYKGSSGEDQRFGRKP